MMKLVMGRVWTLLPIVAGLLLALLTGLVAAGRVVFFSLRDGRIDRKEQTIAERTTLKPFWAALRRFTPIKVD